MNCPRLEIHCDKIHHNAQILTTQLAAKGITMTPVTKVCLGHPEIVHALLDAGAKMLADSRIETIEAMRGSGVASPMMLIRSPMLSQASRVIQSCTLSLNTELAVIQRLSEVAGQSDIVHEVIIMVELGDLREGVMPHDLMDFVRQTLDFPHIKLIGIGTNLSCRYGIAPDEHKMSQLSDLADEIEHTFDIELTTISGGNSANINWALNHESPSRVNNLRLGEAIFLGLETLHQQPIAGLFTDAITLVAEVIEAKEKPSLPWGDLGVNAFGERQTIVTEQTNSEQTNSEQTNSEQTNRDRGNISQAILALGRQDVCILGLTPPHGVSIVASTSDHLIVETSGQPLVVGQEILFHLNYSALLSAMSSPFIHKHLLF